MPRTALLALPALFCLAACSGGDDDSAPGGVTQGEAAALNDAAAMLDANAMAPETVNTQTKE